MLFLYKSSKITSSPREGRIDFAFDVKENTTFGINAIKKLKKFFKRGYASTGVSELASYKFVICLKKGGYKRKYARNSS